MEKKKMNSTEIAKLTGFSRSTVSRVINGYSNVPESTREKIMKVIEEYEYYPSFSGQVLAGKKTQTIGLFWVSRGDISYDMQSSTFMANIIESAAKHNYLALTCIVPNLTDPEHQNQIKRIFLQERIDAGIFVGVNNNEPLIKELLSRDKIVGVFDYLNDNTSPNLITVNFESDTGEKVIDYVYGLGHRKIALIDGNLCHFSSFQRHESFIRGMLKYRLEMRREWMHYGDIIEKGGYYATKDLIKYSKELPTVICANNDAVAFGVYRALTEAGISIPEQVSVIGIDGHERGKLVNPNLTTFTFDFDKFFSSLVSRVVAAIEGKDEIINDEIITSILVTRESCKKME
jgi:LacI family transcriptional regulator